MRLLAFLTTFWANADWLQNWRKQWNNWRWYVQWQTKEQPKGKEYTLRVLSLRITILVYNQDRGPQE